MAESSSGAARSRRRPKMYYPGMHHGRLHQKLIAFAAASAIVWSAWPLAADTYPRQPGIDARHYTVRLTLLTGDSNEIQAEVAVTLRVAAAGTREAILDLTSATPDGKGMHVTGVTAGGAAVPFEHRDNRLHLPIPPQTTAGQDVTFTISYHGVPDRGLLIVNTIHGDRSAFSENWFNRARHWLPMIDHPADKATGEFLVTTKAEYQVVSNGVLVETVDLPGGLRRTHWKQEEPISSWLYSLGVAHFIVRQGDVVRGVPLSFWAFPEDAENGLPALATDARESFEFFSDRVGPVRVRQTGPCRSGRHGRRHGAREQHLLRREGRDGRQRAGGARDRASMVRRCGHRERLERRVAQRGFRDLLHAALHRIRTPAAMRSSTACAAAATPCFGSRSRCRTRRWCTSTLDEAATEPNNRLVYEKGAWTLHMLRDLIGTETVLARHQALLPALRERPGVHGGSAPRDGGGVGPGPALVLRAVADPERRSTGLGQLALRRGRQADRRDGAARHRPASRSDSRSAWASRSRRLAGRDRQVQVTGRESTFRIPADAEPASVVLDPGVWLLAEFGSFSKGS